MCLYVEVCARMYVHVGKGSRDQPCLSRSLSTLLSETRSLTEPQSFPVWLDWLTSKLRRLPNSVPQTLRFQVCTEVPSIYMGYGDQIQVPTVAQITSYQLSHPHSP